MSKSTLPVSILLLLGFAWAAVKDAPLNSLKGGVKAEAAHAIVDHIWNAYLNLDGVVIKMLECGNDEESKKLEGCFIDSMDRLPASILRFDLPLVLLRELKFVGYLYSDVPAASKICAAPIDAACETCSANLKPRCASTYSLPSLLKDFHDLSRGWRQASCMFGGQEGWERATSLQNVLVNELAKTHESIAIHEHEPCAVPYNQVMLRRSHDSELKAVVYRNDSLWVKFSRMKNLEDEWALEHDKQQPDPLISLARAQQVVALVQSSYNVELPVVEIKLPQSECTSPSEVVRRWRQGKHAAVNNLFSLVTKEDPRWREAAKLAQDMGEKDYKRYWDVSTRAAFQVVPSSPATQQRRPIMRHAY